MKDHITKTVKRFYSNVEGNENRHHRYKSWEHCYQHFLKPINFSSEKSVDLANLHLAMYLASWGMYRGSTFSLQHDYKVHSSVITEFLTKDRCKKLRVKNTDIEKNRVIEKFFPANEKTPMEEIKALYSKNGIPEKKVSETLTTKILLGALGNIPAYDRFFKSGLACAVEKLSENSKLNKKNFSLFIDWCNQYLSELEQAQGEISYKAGFDYPIMKMADMYFWQIGKDISDITNNKALKDREKFKEITEIKNQVPQLRAQ